MILLTFNEASEIEHDWSADVTAAELSFAISFLQYQLFAILGEGDDDGEGL